LNGRVQQIPEMRNASIVDQNVNVTFAGSNVLHALAYRFQVAQIDVRQIESVHSHAVFTEQRRNGVSDPASMSRYDGYFFVESR
jgi:hypothetical protein